MPRKSPQPRVALASVPSKPPKPAKAALKRQRIIAAAAAVFRRQGYAQTTLSDIAAEAGTQAGSLYYYFDSREELVEAVLTHSTRRLIERVEAALAELPEDADALDRLVTMIRSHVLSVLNRDDYLIAYQKVHDQVSAELRDRIARVPRAFAKVWNGLFKDAVKEGFVRSDIDPRLTRLLIVGSISWMADWYNSGGPSRPEEIVDAVVHFFFEGAAVDKDAINARIGPRKRYAKRRRAVLPSSVTG